MSKAIVLRDTGGPEVLRVEDVVVGSPGRNELLIRHEAIGVNFHDTYVRSGLYATLSLPGIPGIEAAGTVLEVGEEVRDFRVGDRIVYLDRHYGAYAEQRLLNAVLAVQLPAGVSSELAASVFLKGLTATILAERVHSIADGQSVLVHAAAGGVGRLLIQLLASLGANVIGTVGSDQKAEIARSYGCRHVILYNSEDLVGRVMDITAGCGVSVVYDAVGRDTFDRSLACLATRGHLVNYGQSSGFIPSFDINRLAAKSASITRPIYSHYIADRADLLSLSQSLWERTLPGSLRVQPGICFSLADAPEAHRNLEERIAGPVILIP